MPEYVSILLDKSLSLIQLAQLDHIINKPIEPVLNLILKVLIVSVLDYTRQFNYLLLILVLMLPCVLSQHLINDELQQFIQVFHDGRTLVTLVLLNHIQ